MNSVRQENIRQFIIIRDVVSIRELCMKFQDVSSMTIHRDLECLEKRGDILRIRGGARALPHINEPGYREREKVNSSVKAVIAKKAISLVNGESTIFIDAGTSCMAVARELPDISINVFTTGPNIAIELTKLSKPSISLCCGTLNRENLALSGQNTLEMLESINIDIAYIGISGYRSENGFTCGKESEALVKKMVIAKARKVIGLLDNSKIGRIFPFTFAHIDDFDYLVCEDNLPRDFLELVSKDKSKII